MLDPLAAYIGGIAAFLASLSHVPQVHKAWPRGSTDDPSLFMLATLTLGLGHLRLNPLRLDDRGRERGKAPRSRPSFSAVKSAILNRAAAEASSAAEEC
jgi:hypothetical protein